MYRIDTSKRYDAGYVLRKPGEWLALALASDPSPARTKRHIVASCPKSGPALRPRRRPCPGITRAVPEPDHQTRTVTTATAAKCSTTQPCPTPSATQLLPKSQLTPLIYLGSLQEPDRASWLPGNATSGRSALAPPAMQARGADFPYLHRHREHRHAQVSHPDNESSLRGWSGVGLLCVMASGYIGLPADRVHRGGGHVVVDALACGGLCRRCACGRPGGPGREEEARHERWRP